MPNHVYHTLKITGPEDELERFLSECFTDGDFDFDQLVPEPEHIKESGKHAHDMFPAVVNAGGSVSVDMSDVTPDQIKASFPAWFNWRCEHWGDKWNAENTEVRKFESGAVELKFDTAWSVPVPIFEEIAARFPTLEITGDFIDGQYNWSGEVTIAAGVVQLKETTEENEAIARYRGDCDEGEKELHADLLRHLSGEPNVFEPRTLGWHWAKAAEKLVAEEPGLTDPSRAEELLSKVRNMPAAGE